MDLDAFVTDDMRRQRTSRRVPSKTKVWAIGAAAAVVLLVGSACALGMFPFGPGTSPDTTTKPQTPDGGGRRIIATGPTGELRIESTPDGARVSLDGKESELHAARAQQCSGRPAPARARRRDGTVRRTVRVQAGERTVARYEITGEYSPSPRRSRSTSTKARAKIGVSTEDTSRCLQGAIRSRW